MQEQESFHGVGSGKTLNAVVSSCILKLFNFTNGMIEYGLDIGDNIFLSSICPQSIYRLPIYRLPIVYLSIIHLSSIYLLML
jgi:hypothetical protein